MRMNCPKCNTEIPDTSQFCAQCGAPLTAYGKSVARSKTPAWLVVFVFSFLALMAYVIVHMVNDMEKETANTSKAPTVKAPPQLPPPPQPHFVRIVNTAITVNAGSFAWYPFSVPENANTLAVTGHFTATGGSGNDIIVYILDEDGLANLKNGHPTRTYYNSEKVTQSSIQAVLPPAPGTYYLVFDNRFSLLTPKAVQVNASLSYMQ